VHRKGLSEEKMQKMAVNFSAAPSECPMHVDSNTAPVGDCPMRQGQTDINPDNMVCNRSDFLALLFFLKKK
jgi:hypothetical protein